MQRTAASRPSFAFSILSVIVKRVAINDRDESDETEEFEFPVMC